MYAPSWTKSVLSRLYISTYKTILQRESFVHIKFLYHKSIKLTLTKTVWVLLKLKLPSLILHCARCLRLCSATVASMGPLWLGVTEEQLPSLELGRLLLGCSESGFSFWSSMAAAVDNVKQKRDLLRLKKKKKKSRSPFLLLVSKDANQVTEKCKSGLLKRLTYFIAYSFHGKQKA